MRANQSTGLGTVFETFHSAGSLRNFHLTPDPACPVQALSSESPFPLQSMSSTLRPGTPSSIGIEYAPCVPPLVLYFVRVWVSIVCTPFDLSSTTSDPDESFIAVSSPPRIYVKHEYEILASKYPFA
ncbi:hypothetical protein M404DRAFT_996378 [Pisolithus tinctorius Marx 270]|uniref:Uncharacterized protein n=1 Tax=Pisolithus tinctorius Marx 270 TaxID=870435 RepID=A0A0C3PLD1_PISTI|nr:hypothetical protein M404DRAFT_996378 [Pisolithus tinctorius Marx 270]